MSSREPSAMPDAADVPRRQFLRSGVLGLLSLVASACGLLPAQKATPQPTPTVARATSSSPVPPAATPAPTSTPLPTAIVAPSPTPTKIALAPLLHDENRPGFYVRWIEPFRAPDVTTWRLEIKGLVERPLTLSLAEIEERLPLITQSSRLKCVECWSARRDWGGFRFDSLAELVHPLDSASHVRFDCVDGYWEDLPIKELSRPRALFTHRMDGESLPLEYGAPLRMILPWLYGYKGAKAISSLTFTSEAGRGYYSSRSSYPVQGEIQPGFDQALDLDSKPREITGGEILDF
jgi:sulfoxide reductase catalytic subunit YedY